MRRRINKEEEARPRLSGWIMTYGDMMSLLLTFFILLVSFSTIQDAKFQEATVSLQGAFGVLSNPPTTIKMQEIIVPQLNKKEQEDIIFEFRKLEQVLVVENLDSMVDMQLTKDGVLFQINDGVLFASASADLSSTSHKVLTEISHFMSKFRYEIEISGHTDSVPIKTLKYPSNWELSSARAISVARFLISCDLVPDRIKAVGFGEYRPISTNKTHSGRSENRRVEIFLKLDDNNLPIEFELPISMEGKKDV